MPSSITTGAGILLTIIVTEVAAVFPAVSLTTAVKVWDSLEAVVVSQDA